jgi:hypothetical protein
MVITAEFLGMLLLVTSLAALGLSIVVDVGQVSTEKARESLLQRQHDKRRSALSEWRQKTERKRADLTALQARQTEFAARKHKTLNEIKALELTKVELVHEIGDEDDGAGFWSQLHVMPHFQEIDRREVVFARQIWDYRNVAHIWAPSQEHAQALLSTAFTARNGVQPSMMVPLALAPEPGSEPAPA